MAAFGEPRSSGIHSLSGIIDKIQYKSIVQYLPDTMGLDIKAFEESEYGFQYYLDTSICVTKRKTYNRKCLYDTFSKYCDLSGDEVKAKVLYELESNSVWYTKASAACLGMRGIKFDVWLKKQACPHTWPNELILYALCILFCCNALVINGGRIWTTLKTNQDMTISVIQEMCETTLLYLGNNLYGTLHMKPFTLDRPLKFDLSDMQQMRPIFTDVNTNCMFFEIHKNSDFEQVLRDEEIFDVEEPKPELLPETSTLDILHPDYLQKGVIIKKEPPDATSSIIGEIISQPANVARDIKQELLDSATQSIMEKHSSTCQINQFIQECGTTEP